MIVSITNIARQHHKFVATVGVIVAILFLLFLSLGNRQIYSEASPKVEKNFSLSISKSHTPQNLEANTLNIAMPKLNTHYFNLGSAPYAVIRIDSASAFDNAQEDRIIFLSRNNIFTPIYLHYFDGNRWYKKAFEEASKNRKLLSLPIPEDAVGSTVFLSLAGQYLRGRISLADAKSFYEGLKISNTISGMYYGVSLLFIALSIVIAGLTTTRAYLDYSVFLSVCTLWIASGEGWLITFFPTMKSLPFFTPNALLLLFFISFCSFTRHYLQLKMLNKAVHFYLNVCQWYMALVWVVFCLSFNNAPQNLYQFFYAVTLLVGISTILVSLYGAGIAVRLGRLQARFYLLALGIFALVGMTSALSISGIIPLAFGWQTLQLASLIEMILLAVGFLLWHMQKTRELQQLDTVFKDVNLELSQARLTIDCLKENMQVRAVSPTFAPEIAKVVSLFPSLLYIKASGNYSVVFARTKTGINEILIDCTLQSIADAIGEQQLLRCHKSYLVPTQRDFKLIRRTSADFDLITDDVTVPVGRKYKNYIKEFLKGT